MTKRQLIIIGILALGLTMIGFGTQYVKEPMTISQAQLTNQESQIVSLVDVESMIFDFTADRDAKTVSFACYKLDEAGNWRIHNGWQNYPVTQARGRIAVSYEDIDTGMRVAVQTGDSTYAGENNSSVSGVPTDSEEGMGSATSYGGPDKIEYEKEIPLVMQVFTTKDEINSCDVALFDQPEEFVKQGYSAVYVVVAKFSKKEII